VGLVSGVLGLDDDDLKNYPISFYSTSKSYSQSHLGVRAPSHSAFECSVSAIVGKGEEIYLLAGISAPGDDGNAADLEDCN
jgi:hypothetical protein